MAGYDIPHDLWVHYVLPRACAMKTNNPTLSAGACIVRAARELHDGVAKQTPSGRLQFLDEAMSPAIQYVVVRPDGSVIARDTLRPEENE